MALVVFFVASSAHAQVILRVDKDQTTNPPNGLSWSYAYPTLTAGLAEARIRLNNGNPSQYVSQIWVAEGVYKPTTSTTDRTATFHLVPNVAVYGGFLATEQTLAARAGNYDLTILSGDIDGDPRNQLADSLHVVTIDEAGAFRLDGFQVMFGAAVPNPPSGSAVTVDDFGGGLLVTGGSGLADVFVTNVRFQACIAGVGGGAYVAGADFKLSRCNFVACIASLPSTMTGTVSAGGGGALAVYNCPTAYVYNSTFSTNRASNGGALLFSANTETRMVNCLIANNTAIAGGGVFIWTALQPVVLDFCTMAGNVSLEPGETQSAPYVGGGAIYMAELARLEVRSSIVWGNTDQNQVVSGSSHTIAGPGAIPVATWGATGVVVTYSDFDVTVTPNWFATIQNISLSTNNIVADPLFVNPGAGNYRILPGSPCIDAADDTVFDTAQVTALNWNDGLGDILDINENGITNEFLPWDLDDATRELDLQIPNTGLDVAELGRIGDMGCYEQFLNVIEP